MESIAFKEGINGWTSRLSFSPESAVYLNSNYYTFKNGEMWKHHSENVNHNTFYGTKYNSTIKFIQNEEPTSIKHFKTINYEGSIGWKATSIETDQQSGKVLTFIPKEGKWFNNIKGVASNLNNLDPKEFSIQGLGNASSLSGLGSSVLTINTSFTHNASLQKGDVIYYLEGSTIKRIGPVSSLTAGSIVCQVDGDTSLLNNNSYVFFGKDNEINIGGVIGYYAEIEMTNESANDIELFQVSSQIFLSSN